MLEAEAQRTDLPRVAWWVAVTELRFESCIDAKAPVDPVP